MLEIWQPYRKNSSLISPPPIKKADLPIIQTGISQPIISGPISIPISNYRNKSNLFWIFGVLTLLLSAFIIWQIGFHGIPNLFSSNNNLPVPTSTNDLALVTETTASSAVSTEPSQPQKTVINSDLSVTQSAQLVVTPTGGGGGLIAYASNQGSDVMQLWLMQVDGGKERQITFIDDGACQPTWSPDGQKLAFISPCPNKMEIYEGSKIYTYDLINNGEIIPLPLPADPSGDFDPAWSPDGTKMAFTSLRPGNDPETKEKRIHIYIYDFNDGILDEVTDTRWKDRHPAWSPDSEMLAFVRKIATTEIWWVTINGIAPERFSGATTKYYNYPTWSKDGKIIFYTEQSSEVGLPYFSGKRIADASLPLEFRDTTNRKCEYHSSSRNGCISRWRMVYF